MYSEKSLKISTLLGLATWMLLIVSATGCAAGAQRVDAPEGRLLFIREGYLASPDLPDHLLIPDQAERLKAVEKGIIPLRDVVVVPGPVFKWMMKELAKRHDIRITTLGDLPR